MAIIQLSNCGGPDLDGGSGGERCSDSRNILKGGLVPTLDKWEIQLALELSVLGPCSYGVRTS